MQGFKVFTAYVKLKKVNLKLAPMYVRHRVAVRRIPPEF